MRCLNDSHTQVTALIAKVGGVVGASVVIERSTVVRYAVSANQELTQREFGSQILTIIGAIVRTLLSRVILATASLGRAVASNGVLDLVYNVVHDE